MIYATLVCIGLAFSLPFLSSDFRPPIGSFYSELIAFACWTAAMTCAIFIRKPLELKLPVMGYCFLGFIVLLTIQWALGMVGYPQHALIGMLYLLLAAGVCTLGNTVARLVGVQTLVNWLAWCTLIGATLCAIAGFWQAIVGPNQFVMPLMGPRIYGNTGQANHFADYVFCGLASLVYLSMRDTVTPWHRDFQAAIFSIVLAPALALSGSRAVWVYFALLIGFLCWREFWQGLKTAAFALGIYAVTESLTLYTSRGAGLILHASSTGESVRLRLYSDALQMFMAHPWLGVGFRQFAYQHFLIGASGGEEAISDNAHNLPLHLMAEFGVAGLLVLLLPLALWLFRRWQISPERWWALMLLGVIGTHSLVEHPLDYAYFLGIAAFLWGVTQWTGSASAS
jgi:O-antigen ligase